MIRQFVRKLSQSSTTTTLKGAKPSIEPNLAANLGKPRKVWPPNFEELSPQQQFRLEKKYKRRIQMASYSPKWEKNIKYLQYGFCSSVFLFWLMYYTSFDLGWLRPKPAEEMHHDETTLFGFLDREKRFKSGATGKLQPISEETKPKH
ncbi:hypothetical protein CDD81_1149 [Ophiocordyceps australis]|uniref:Uncharacterized protein n=1 Tax=Ophiocordyceps australis TaxID=1399860 RepID=A0A2C5XFJ9_9HYPO|nr:hypothetical protein CDD81_1149 [Ophiocordyceps australis]